MTSVAHSFKPLPAAWLAQALACTLLTGAAATSAQTYTGSRTSTANCNDLRASCESKANRQDARTNTGAAATAGIGAAALHPSRTNLDAWSSAREKDTGRSISDLWRQYEAEFKRQDEADRVRRAQEEERLKTPEGKRDHYAKLAGKGEPRYDYIYSIYAEATGKEAEGRKWLQLAAEAGWPAAQYQLAFRTRYGFHGDKPDFKAAYNWAARAAVSGMPQGMGMMAGMLFHRVDGLPDNMESVLNLAKPACEKQSAEGCETLGLMAVNGLGMPQDFAAARQYFEQTIVAARLPNNVTYGPSEANANFQLAMMHLDGKGVPADKAKARAYLKAFTEAPLSIMENDGWMAYSVELIIGPDQGLYGFPRDFDTGLKYLRRTAERGSTAALNLLGSWTAAGMFGVPKDVNAGVAWLQKAVDRGDKASTVTMAKVLMDNGRKEEAMQAVQKGVAMGSKAAMYLQAVYTYKGLGVAANAAAGRDALLRACEAGHAKACAQASQMAAAGTGAFAKDAALANQLAQRAKAAASDESDDE